MFGAKYSRLIFWIWSVVLLIPFSLFSQLMRATESDPELANSSLIFSVLLFIVAIIWTNALANRIRDYGSDPWIAVFAFLPLANIGLALYYGIVQYKNKSTESNTNYNNSASLSKAVYNHSKDIVKEVKPTINEYKEKHKISASDTANISSIDEDEIYEKVMIEIEENNKVKSTWAKALSQSEGDKDKAEAIYIKLRVEKLKTKIKNTAQIQENKNYKDIESSDEDEVNKIFSQHQNILLNNSFNDVKQYLIEFYKSYNYYPKVNSEKSLILKNNDLSNSYVILEKNTDTITIDIFNLVYIKRNYSTKINKQNVSSESNSLKNTSIEFSVLDNINSKDLNNYIKNAESLLCTINKEYRVEEAKQRAKRLDHNSKYFKSYIAYIQKYSN